MDTRDKQLLLTVALLTTAFLGLIIVSIVVFYPG